MINEQDSPREPNSLAQVKLIGIEMQMYEEPAPEFLPILEKAIEMDHRDWA